MGHSSEKKLLNFFHPLSESFVENRGRFHTHDVDEGGLFAVQKQQEENLHGKARSTYSVFDEQQALVDLHRQNCQ